MKAAESDGSALDASQARAREQRFKLTRIYTTMPVKVAKEAGLAGLSQIHDQYAAGCSDCPPDLARALLLSRSRQVVEHEGRQDDVELPVGKREDLGRRHAE